VIKAGKKTGLQKFAATGCKELTKNGQVILSFEEPVDVSIERKDNKIRMIIADGGHAVKPVINRLWVD